MIRIRLAQRFVAFLLAVFFLIQLILYLRFVVADQKQKSHLLTTTHRLDFLPAKYKQSTASDEPIISVESLSSPPSGGVNWMDAIVAAQYPEKRVSSLSSSLFQLKVVYPIEWKNDPVIGRLFRKEAKEIKDDAEAWRRGEILAQQRGFVKKRAFRKPMPVDIEVIHTHWEPNPQRRYGKQDQSLVQSDGGRTVQGTWPDAVTDLTFIAVLKNAHTTLLNTVGDLRQRLGTPSVTSSTLYRAREDVKPILEMAMQQQQQENNKKKGDGHVVFAVVRDPVDRFLSATCQDMSKSTHSIRKTIAACQGLALQHDNNGALGLVDCITEILQENGRFTVHQVPQVSILLRSLQDTAVGVTLIPQEKALASIILEMGGHNFRVRDRKHDAVYKKSLELEQFCQLIPANLTEKQLEAICTVYAADVRMMELAGIEVPLCSPTGLAVEESSLSARAKR